ncbi:MAG TPA: glycosyltransferase family 2 protein [Terriglobia bacterium]|nr:glycosyltransferase family 2 protein [Terriglobia bacterium]
MLVFDDFDGRSLPLPNPPPPSMPSISATIVARNEAANIARALQSLALADEILVVDSGSTDDTCKIATGMGARVLVEPWRGFAAQKNFAARAAKHDWILSLDADEEFDARAKASIHRWKASEPDAAGYRFARRARYCGKWINHSGWYPDYKTRLYHRLRGEWTGSHVHESVAVTGQVRVLPGEILHYTCDSLADHRNRIEFYTGLAAEQMMAEGRSAGPLRRLVAPPWEFLRTYLFRLGILDGAQGFWIARMAALYVERKNAKWAAKKNR